MKLIWILRILLSLSTHPKFYWNFNTNKHRPITTTCARKNQLTYGISMAKFRSWNRYLRTERIRKSYIRNPALGRNQRQDSTKKRPSIGTVRWWLCYGMNNGPRTTETTAKRGYCMEYFYWYYYWVVIITANATEANGCGLRVLPPVWVYFWQRNGTRYYLDDSLHRHTHNWFQRHCLASSSC